MTATRRMERSDPPAATVRSRRRLRDRITAGHLVPVLLGLAAAVLIAIGLGERGSTTTIPVAAHPIAVGATVNAGDTRIVTVHSSDTGVLSGILPVSNIGAGWVATVPIVAGDPITRSEVARAASGTQGLGAMSIPVSVADADGGAIVAGDVVDVISMNTGGGPQYVAQRLRVLSVAPSSSSSGVLTTGNGDYYVVVAVDRPTALQVASALAAGSAGNSSGVLVVRTTGEPPTPTTGGSS